MTTYIEPPMFDVASTWLPCPVTSLPTWSGARRVALDVETRDDSLTTLGSGVRRGGYVVGVSVAIQRGIAADAQAYYLPIAHAGGDNLPAGKVWEYLRNEAQAFQGEIVGANLPYDLDYLWFNRVQFPLAREYRDVQIAEPLLNELETSYSLEEIAHRNGFEGKNEGGLLAAATAWGVDPKGELWKLPARHVGPYAEMDTLLPLRILEVQEKRIGDQKLWPIYNLESRVLPVLCRMRARGVPVDFNRLQGVEADALAQEAEALERVYALTGVRIAVGEVWVPTLVERALKATGWVPVNHTAKGKVTLDADTLDGIDHDAAREISRARRANKIRTTFAASVREYACGGRIHTTFNQLRYQREEGGLGGAAFGRLSSVDPNMQQIPARDEEWGPKFRSIYIPEPGERWLSLDYSAQEPRWVVHFSNKIHAPGATQMVRRYLENPRLDLHQETANLAGISRKQAKIIFLGLCYGMGGAKLCRSLGYSTVTKTIRGKEIEVAGPEGDEFLAKFNSLVPFVKTLAQSVKGRAEKNGYVVTALGRRCRFPIYEKEHIATHKALNRLIQGSSADQTKKALVDLDEAGIPLTLQVHDEVCFSCASQAQKLLAIDIMQNCIQMDIPSIVDAEEGASWGEAE